MSKPRKLASGRWQIRWFDVDGKRQSTTFVTYDLARTELRRLEVTADEVGARREKLGTGALTVREAFAAFMARRKPDPGNTLRRFEERAWRAVTRGGPDDLVVLVGGVRPLRKGYDDMAGKTRAACKRASLAPLTFHSLRATYATLVADAGLPIGKLSALLGHSDIATTAIYIRPESAAAATDRRAILGGAASNGDGAPSLN